VLSAFHIVETVVQYVMDLSYNGMWWAFNQNSNIPWLALFRNILIMWQIRNFPVSLMEFSVAYYTFKFLTLLDIPSIYSLINSHPTKNEKQTLFSEWCLLLSAEHISVVHLFEAFIYARSPSLMQVVFQYQNHSSILRNSSLFSHWHKYLKFLHKRTILIEEKFLFYWMRNLLKT